ncbi:L,D-transpeptidase family protein [Sporolactobacillus shoreicorticis]|uniref:L,D-transpeptidase n=1 Tax=Sporolactobacillus shoreicorticis TaxID=1923877 RepID=A0ABW5S3F6_9BACL|nr:L,D-transpeptidase family protein [Sporolactobacillus shoreicorticis]MCO7124191.1 L,D-transpeptidase family protein [Sporolactobacillus shoreicorticis]
MNKRTLVCSVMICLIISIFLPWDSSAKQSIYSKAKSQQIVNKMKSIKKNRQMILVTASGYGKRAVTIQAFSKNKHSKWSRILITHGIIGKNGFTHNFSERSKGSPEGKYTITRAFGRYKNPGTKLSYHRITADDVWVDNVHSKYYNSLQSIRKTHQYSERMNIPQYDYGFVINYNTKIIKGKGSAVFFHIAHGSYTLGCTATSKGKLVSLLKWLDPKKKPVIIQTVTKELNRY